ncbi:hypothetical protein AAY473_016492, partial [Plecturocebus cupreus]
MHTLISSFGPKDKSQVTVTPNLPMAKGTRKDPMELPSGAHRALEARVQAHLAHKHTFTGSSADVYAPNGSSYMPLCSKHEQHCKGRIKGKYVGRLRQEDCLKPGVCNQPGQQSGIPSLQKIRQKLSRCGGMYLWSQLLRRLRWEDHLSPGVGGCSELPRTAL